MDRMLCQMQIISDSSHQCCSPSCSTLGISACCPIPSLGGKAHLFFTPFWNLSPTMEMTLKTYLPFWIHSTVFLLKTFLRTALIFSLLSFFFFRLCFRLIFLHPFFSPVNVLILRYMIIKYFLSSRQLVILSSSQSLSSEKSWDKQ